MALSYPFVFNYPAGKHFTPLIVDFIEDSLRKSYGDGSPEGKEGKSTKSAPQKSARQIVEKPIQPTEPVPVSREMSTASVTPTDTPTGIETAIAGPVPTTAVGNISLPQTNGIGGNGTGTGIGNFGLGIGSGVSTGDGVGDSRFVQVGYAYSPKPEYPEGARREGKEGQVLLRVLVDAEGKPKTVEINRSSGSDALDRTAAETIKRWRFSPARHGEKKVESWVRVPIDFRLRDATN